MPPESWCGYSFTRRPGAGMPTRASASTAFASASRAERPWCSRRVSPIWRPTVSTGLSEVIGSWKIIAMSSPRSLRIAASERSSRFRPSNMTAPAVFAGGDG
jgi:hypothetical protein